jgi:branched-chain amino acid transport system ATP-binding protein
VLLELEGVHAHYGKSHILNGVTLCVDAGETVCLLGRNGVGKSTMMKTVIGLVPTTSGTVRYKGSAIERLTPHRIARMGLGYIPEDRRIFPTITVRENLLMGVKAGTSGQVQWTLERVFEFFPLLRERGNQRAGTLSGGEQQMLTIARTLMGNPDLLLVDEPTEGLAPHIVEQVERILIQVKQSSTAVLLVEQALDTAVALADRCYVMAKGQIVFAGTMTELNRAHEIRRQYLEV